MLAKATKHLKIFPREKAQKHRESRKQAWSTETSSLLSIKEPWHVAYYSLAIKTSIKGDNKKETLNKNIPSSSTSFL